MYSSSGVCIYCLTVMSHKDRQHPDLPGDTWSNTVSLWVGDIYTHTHTHAHTTTHTCTRTHVEHAAIPLSLHFSPPFSLPAPVMECNYQMLGGRYDSTRAGRHSQCSALNKKRIIFNSVFLSHLRQPSKSISTFLFSPNVYGMSSFHLC